MTIMHTNTPINRDERITAIKSIALEYKSITSLTTTNTHVIIICRDQQDTDKIVASLKEAGFYEAAAYVGSFTKVWFIRIPI